jgi:hypothetical protein
MKACRTDAGLVIDVADNGPGLPPDARAWRLVDAQRQHGHPDPAFASRSLRLSCTPQASRRPLADAVALNRNDQRVQSERKRFQVPRKPATSVAVTPYALTAA